MSSLLASTLDHVRIYAGAVTWGPLVQTCRRSILSLFANIRIGCLTVVERDGTETRCGKAYNGGAEPLAQLHVVREAFWPRLAIFADMVRTVAQMSRTVAN